MVNDFGPAVLQNADGAVMDGTWRFTAVTEIVFVIGQLTILGTTVIL